MQETPGFGKLTEQKTTNIRSTRKSQASLTDESSQIKRNLFKVDSETL